MEEKGTDAMEVEKEENEKKKKGKEITMIEKKGAWGSGILAGSSNNSGR